MKNREIACINYLNEGNCKISREGTFRKQCQHCNRYQPVRGGKPARKNTKKEKEEKYNKDFRNFE
jgi:hypothetical protein